MKFFPSKAATVILLFFALHCVSAAERNFRKGTKVPKNDSRGKASKAPKIAKASKAPKISKKTLDFLTYNLYLGADLTPLLQDPENTDPCVVYEEATALDFPSRVISLSSIKLIS